MAREVLTGKAETGKRVLIMGGNGLGLEIAAFLAMQGKQVEVTEMTENVGRDLGATVRWHLRHRLEELGVKIFTSVKVIGFRGNRASLMKTDGSRRESDREADTVVIAAGSRSRNRLAAGIRRKVPEVYVIGDAAEPRNALFAMREGAETGLKI